MVLRWVTIVILVTCVALAIGTLIVEEAAISSFAKEISAMVDAPNAISHSIFCTFYMRTLLVSKMALVLWS